MSVTGIRSADICIYQGDDFACWITILNQSDGTLADLTDFTAQAQIRNGPADQTPGSIAATITTTLCAPSYASLWIPREQTRRLRDLEYVWDLNLISSAGNVTTILRGDVHVVQEVTRREWRGHLWDAIIASQPLWRPVQLYRANTGLREPWGRNDPWR